MNITKERNSLSTAKSYQKNTSTLKIRSIGAEFIVGEGILAIIKLVQCYKCKEIPFEPVLCNNCGLVYCLMCKNKDDSINVTNRCSENEKCTEFTLVPLINSSRVLIESLIFCCPFCSKTQKSYNSQ